MLHCFHKFHVIEACIIHELSNVQGLKHMQHNVFVLIAYKPNFNFCSQNKTVFNAKIINCLILRKNLHDIEEIRRLNTGVGMESQHSYKT